MTRYGSADPTVDVAALSLGTAADDEHPDKTRQQAVEAVVGHLQRREGEVTSVPVGILRQEAWDVDAGATASTAREAWQSYVRPALAELSTVENVQPGRWRYSGLPDKAATSRQAGDEGTADHDPAAEDETADASASATLSDEAQAGADLIERVEHGDGNAALAAALLDKHSDGDTAGPSSVEPDYRDAGAALASKEQPDRGPTPDPNGEGEAEGSDSVGARVERGEAGSQARIERRARREAAREANEEAALSTAAGEAQPAPSNPCARCETAEAEVDAPPLHAQLPPNSKLCRSCYREVALGQARTDTIDGGDGGQ
jgi:hypothetical protein